MNTLKYNVFAQMLILGLYLALSLHCTALDALLFSPPLHISVVNSLNHCVVSRDTPKKRSSTLSETSGASRATAAIGGHPAESQPEEVLDENFPVSGCPA